MYATNPHSASGSPHGTPGRRSLILHLRTRVAWIVAAILLGPAGVRAQTPDVPAEVLAYAEIVLHNGQVLTADDRFTIAQAVAIRDGKFLAAGTNDRILKMAGPRTRKIDLKGKTVTPGFLDTHLHLDDYAMRDMLLLSKGIQWEGKILRSALWWNDTAMAMRDIGKAIAAAKPGEMVWLIARDDWPGDWLRNMRLDELDALSPQNPVVICGNVGIESPVAVNTKALALASIPAGTPGLPMTDSPAIRGAAAELFGEQVLTWRKSLDEAMPWFKKRLQLANSWGITLAESRILPSHWNALRELWLKGELTVRFRLAFPGDLDVTKVGNISDIGDDLLKITGISTGGALGGAPMGGPIMSFEPPLRLLPGMSERRAAQATTRGFAPAVRAALVETIRYGWSTPNTHINGDLATAEYLAAIEEAVKSPIVKSSNQRLTMDHLMQVRPQEVQKMKELGVRPSISPWFVFTEQNIANSLQMYGADRVNEMMPIKSYIRAGIRPSLEADGGWDPGGKPLWKIMKAITRKDDKDGRVWNEKEKITRQEGLWMSTSWSAETTGDGGKLGTIEPGRLADLVVLGQDYLTVPEDTIADIPILMTIVGGKVVFEAAAASWTK